MATRTAEIDPLLFAVLLAVEDRRVRLHPGIDPLAVARAIAQAIRHGRAVSGASTFSMQVARLLESRPRTLRAKAIEALRALQLEWRLDKEGMLDTWLTLAPMGGNLEGVRAGSLAWLGREPQAPARLGPDLEPAAARRARDRVLARAVAAGVLDAGTPEAARGVPLPAVRRPIPFSAPHLAWRRTLAAPPGARLSTTLDGELQRSVERLARDGEAPAALRGRAVELLEALGAPLRGRSTS